jgi:hypothetical protein
MNILQEFGILMLGAGLGALLVWLQQSTARKSRPTERPHGRKFMEQTWGSRKLQPLSLTGGYFSEPFTVRPISIRCVFTGGVGIQQPSADV